MEIIGSLPVLESFILFGITFSRNEWRGDFLGLKLLEISDCYGLKQWRSTEDDSNLPVLENLDLYEANEVDELPFSYRREHASLYQYDILQLVSQYFSSKTIGGTNESGE